MAKIRAIPDKIQEGGKIKFITDEGATDYKWYVETKQVAKTKNINQFIYDTSGLDPGGYTVKVKYTKGGQTEKADINFTVLPRKFQTTVTMQPSEGTPSKDQALWVAIRNRTAAIGFDHYSKLIDCVFCPDSVRATFQQNLRKGINDPKSPWAACLKADPSTPYNFTFHGPYAYYLLKLATQVFLILQCGVVIRDGELFDPIKESQRLGRTISLPEIQQQLADHYLVNYGGEKVLPFLGKIVEALGEIEEGLPFCDTILKHRMSCPSMLELIWSYWHEEGMLAQTMNAITLRFQNRRASFRDPLSELEIDPLRPLNHILWGFIQDEHNRLTVLRRAYEYDHHYGLTLVGKATPTLSSADSRSKFLESFHNLLSRTAIFYREDSDTTVVADAFPLLNTLREVHMILAEGAHNQFGDLPWTARAEMLLMQWLLARPEMREFLRGRHMVPYHELWMGAVDAMKKLQGWTDTGVSHFHELAITGERILLSLRYGDWMDVNLDENEARNWARYWKADIQSYIHNYHAVTGVDLAVEISDTRDAATRYLQPSVHLKRRLEAQRSSGKRIALAKKVSGSLKELEYESDQPRTLSRYRFGPHR